VRAARASAPPGQQDRCRYNRRVGLFGVPCAGCARQLRIDTDKCWGCGRAITADERAVERARRVKRGRRCLGILAVVFAVFGLLDLADHDRTSDWISAVDLAVAGLFTAFWLWARRAPVAALAFAIAVHLGVWIVAGVADRSMLLHGYIIRVAALAILAAGLRAALAARQAAAVTPPSPR
jgi:hypothetical protein